MRSSASARWRAALPLIPGPDALKKEHEPAEFRMNRSLKLALCLALFLSVCGARLWLVDRCASDAPAWDQWDGIGGDLFRPYARNTLSAADFFKPHNEHRILFTRLLSFGLMLANRQWDNRLESAANAVICGLTAALLYWLILSLHPPRGVALPAFAALALALSLPFAWQSILFGFQSQFIFLILFSASSMALLVLAAPWTGRWLAGWGLGCLGLLTMASGLLVGAAVLIFAAADGLLRRRGWKTAGATMGAAALIIVAGWALHVEVAQHHELRVASGLQFLTAFARCLAWPHLIGPGLQYPWPAFFNWLPFVLLASAYCRSPGTASKLERFTLVFGLWLLLQSAAVAYARGGPNWRYLDLLSLGLVVNTLSIRLLLARRGRPCPAGWMMAAWLAWAAFSGWGLFTLTRQALREEIPRHMYFADRQKENLRAFLRADDERCLAAKSSDEISFPASDVSYLADLLCDPFIRAVLPAGLRGPLDAAPAPAAADKLPPGQRPAFKDGAGGRISRLAERLAQRGHILLLAGLVLAGAIGLGHYCRSGSGKVQGGCSGA